MFELQYFHSCNICQAKSPPAEYKEFITGLGFLPGPPDGWLNLPVEEGEMMKHICPVCIQKEKDASQTKKEAYRLLQIILEDAT